MVLSILFASHRNRAFPQLSSISKRGMSSRSRWSRARGWIPAVRSKVVVVLGVPSFLEAQFANRRLGLAMGARRAWRDGATSNGCQDIWRRCLGSAAGSS